MNPYNKRTVKPHSFLENDTTLTSDNSHCFFNSNCFLPQTVEGNGRMGSK